VPCRFFCGLACAAALFLGGCSRPVELPPAVAMDSEISPQPPRVGGATVTLKLADAGARQISGAHVVVEAEMSHAGMRPLFAEAKEAEPGRYLAHVEFQMAGDWVILLHVTLASGKKLERQIDIGNVRPN